MTPHFLKLYSRRMPQPLEVWALHPYPFDIEVPNIHIVLVWVYYSGYYLIIKLHLYKSQIREKKKKKKKKKQYMELWF